MTGTLGLYYDMWGDGETGPPARSRNPRQLYRRAVWFKSNPRSASAMEQLFLESFAGGHFVDVSKTKGWRREAVDCDIVVLLYPDAIGLGFGAIERQVLRNRARNSRARVLNGRKRDFLLTPSVRRGLRWRRMLERTMAGELLFALVFIAATPLMLSFDLVRGRR
ncbi:MAG: hypothetical protein IH905_11500 [Proteobacteria bacterium]|nr:hypothetical protein [Pseudomonadota bacterium]